MQYLALFAGVATVLADDYYQIFDNEWPHCENEVCYTGKTLPQITDACDAQDNCFGFSISVSGPPYNGCYKIDTQQCVVNGFGSNSHGFYIRDEIDEGLSTGFVHAWTDKWPHCTNIECNHGTTEAYMKQRCLLFDNCIGFSWDGDWGCLKKDDGGCAANGFGDDTHGYFARVSDPVPTCEAKGKRLSQAHVCECGSSCDGTFCKTMEFVQNRLEDTLAMEGSCADAYDTCCCSCPVCPDAIAY